jgi:GntR family transcriptional regulator
MTTAAASPQLNPAKGVSLHRQLFLVLREQIIRGTYEPGSALPTEEGLCEHFGVSRITVRRTLADLAALGLVERRHGLGTFVRRDLPPPRPIPSLGLLDALRKSALETEVEVLDVKEELPPREVSSSLRLSPGERAVHALRVRSIEAVPVMLTDAWVPLRLRKRVTASTLRRSALYEILMSQGIKFGRVVQEITAAVAGPQHAQVLKIEVGAPMLKLVRVMHDADAQPVLHISVYLSPERSRILMDIPGDTVNTLSAGQFVHDIR